MRGFKHGMTGSKTWKAWKAMRERCNNPNNSRWERYGGRGISYDPRWDVFAMFHADMGECPVGRSLERIDNDGNYCKTNCRWATPREQAFNRKPGRLQQIFGRTSHD